MSSFFKRIVPTTVAMAAGLITLAGYLVPNDVLLFARQALVEWAVIVGGFALILGFFNVLRVHLGRLSRFRPGWSYSAALVLSAVLVMIPLLGDRRGPAGPGSEMLFRLVISPLQAAVGALVAFTLAVAAFRLFRVRRGGGPVLFVLIVVLVLLGATPVFGEWSQAVGGLRLWIVQVPGLAGMRGLLLGVALGTVITGLRLIIGADRPHSE